MPFGSLWLPVVVAAVAVWIVSAILHMVLRYHRTDYKPLSDEAGVGPVLRKAATAPGVYAIPYCTEPSQMKDPAVRKRYEDGPVALITVLRSGPPAMGKYLLLWFLFCFLVSFVTGYLARHTLAPGADGLDVLRITGTAAFLAYGFGYIQDSIWKGIPWINSIKGIVDAAIYAVVTGVVFRCLWPGA